MDATSDPVLRALAQGIDGADFSSDEVKSVVPFLFFSAGGAAEPSPALKTHLDAFCREAGIDATRPPQEIEAAVHAWFSAHPPSKRVLVLVREILGGAALEEQQRAGQASSTAIGGGRDHRPVAGRSTDGFRLGTLGTHAMQQVLDLKREPADVPCGQPGDTPPLSETNT